MIPFDLHMEGNDGEQDKDGKSDNLLNDLQLHEVERSSVADKSHAVGGNLQAVFEEGNRPREDNNANKR